MVSDTLQFILLPQKHILMNSYSLLGAIIVNGFKIAALKKQIGIILSRVMHFNQHKNNKYGINAHIIYTKGFYASLLGQGRTKDNMSYDFLSPL